METVSEMVSTFVVNAIWQVSVVLLIAAICSSLMKSASARHKHILWTATLMLSVSLPILSLGKYGMKSFGFDFQSPSGGAQSDILGGNELIGAATAQNETSIQSVTGLDNSRASVIITAITIFYLAFLFYQLTILSRTWLRTVQLRRSGRSEKLPPLLNAVAERCASILETGSVPILFSSKTKAPLTLGTRKPLIILPESFLDVTSEETLTAAVGHESAHIRRRDYGLNLICEFLSLLVSFHPAIKVMKRKIDQTREMACDELVTEQLLKPLDYARSLVQIAGFVSPTNQNAFTLGVFNADILEKRIMQLIEKSRGAKSRTGKIRFLFVVTLLGMTAMVTSVFALDLQFKQKAETEQVTSAGPDLTFQENDPEIVNKGVINGKAVKLPIPEYPDEAKQANVGGIVNVLVIVDEDGNVASANAVPVVVKVYRTGGTETVVSPEETAIRKLLNESAENAAKQAKFAPTLLEGKPVKVKGIIVYNFGTVKDNDAKTATGEVLNGKATSLPMPEYPSAAKAVKAQGTVHVQVIVDEDGNVSSAQVISGHPLLRQSAIKAAKEAKFSPSFLNGQAVKVNGVLVYNFSSAADLPAEVNENRGNINSGASEESASKPLRILSKSTAQYTDEARRNGVSGTIKLRVTFLASGAIGDVTPISELPGGLTENAVAAAKNIKFEPATTDGTPVTVTKIIEYSFMNQ